MSDENLELHRDAFGRLQLQRNGQTLTVVPVRSFPISAPNDGIALVGGDGVEVVWLETLEGVAPPTRLLIEEELASREFTPEIQHIHSVSSYATPSRWNVDTDRGPAELLLKGEEDIRRLSAHTLLIADYHGVQFLIRDVSALDKASRRLLDHFM